MVDDDEGLSIAAVHRIIRKAGAERVSESAAKELARILEEMGVKIGRESLDSPCTPEEEQLGERM